MVLRRGGRSSERQKERDLYMGKRSLEKGLEHRDRSQSRPRRRQAVSERRRKSSSDGDSSNDDDEDRRRHRAPEKKEKGSKQRKRLKRRSHSSSDDSDGDAECVPELQRRQIKPRTYDGATSFETFWAHFECCSEYNQWTDTDKLAYLKAALVGDAGQILWDSDPKDTSTVTELEALLRRLFSGSIQSDSYQMELKIHQRQSGESLFGSHQDI